MKGKVIGIAALLIVSIVLASCIVNMLSEPNKEVAEMFKGVKADAHAKPAEIVVPDMPTEYELITDAEEYAVEKIKEIEND